MTKRVPERTCIGCRETAGKRALCRIVRTPEGDVVVDRTGKRPGRGAYVHADAACVRQALKGERLARALRAPVTAEAWARLEEELVRLVARAELLARGQVGSGGAAPVPVGRGCAMALPSAGTGVAAGAGTVPRAEPPGGEADGRQDAAGEG